MSYILDALRRSERERGAAPAMASADATPALARTLANPWLVLALAAGGAIIAAATVWLALREPPPVPETVAPPVPLAAPLPAPVSEPRDLAAEARVSAPVRTPRAAVPAATAAAPAVASTEVPFLRALPDEMRRALPEMAVNIHVYTPEPARRMLYINNREYRPGEFIGAVLIEDVLPDGVLMNYQGVRFKLERPR